jgi:Flp pilus assembly protein TadG
MTDKAKTLSRGDAGNAVIELAFLLPILATMIIGITDLGRYAYASIEVANAAHQGAMYGAQSRITACDDKGMRATAQADASDLSGLTVSVSGYTSHQNCTTLAMCACSNTPQTLASCSTISCGVNRVVPYVQVNTQATVNPIFNVSWFPSSLTVYGQAIMRVEQ